jgi:hypothetical protein
MEMARVADWLTRCKTGYQVIALGAALGMLVGGGGCSKPLCPAGMRVDPQRNSQRFPAGANAFCVNPADKSHTVFIQLHPNGARRQVCPFIDGKPAGAYQAFHAGGERWLEGRYENGLKVGRWTQWAPDGRKVADGEYREGLTIEGAPVGFPATCESITW